MVFSIAWAICWNYAIGLYPKHLTSNLRFSKISRWNQCVLKLRIWSCNTIAYVLLSNMYIFKWTQKKPCTYTILIHKYVNDVSQTFIPRLLYIGQWWVPGICKWRRFIEQGDFWNFHSCVLSVLHTGKRINKSHAYIYQSCQKLAFVVIVKPITLYDNFKISWRKKPQNLPFIF